MDIIAPHQFRGTVSWMTGRLGDTDAEVNDLCELELSRQQSTINLIASENIASVAVREATGSVMTNKYAEGYPNARYYGGCKYVDQIEEIAIERLKKLFNCRYANVQAHSGSQANQAVFLALLEPGDRVLGMDLAAGGHLTHGSRVNLSGKWFECYSYGVNRDTGYIEMDEVRAIALKYRPRLIIAGGSAYSRHIDFSVFREIADSVGAYLLVDMAHIAGLVAGGVHSNPVDYAHIVTATTHKVLRGPRGGLIITNEEPLFKRVSSGIFPGIQGGPMMHLIAAKAVAFGEALKPGFKDYTKAVIENAKVLAATLQAGGCDLVTGGTDTHLMLVDLRNRGLKGNVVADTLEQMGIICNKNGVPYDNEKPAITSGIRLGTPTGTSRGFGAKEFKKVGSLITEILTGLSDDKFLRDTWAVKDEVSKLCEKFPIYVTGE